MAKQKFWNGTAWEVVGSDAEKIAIKDTGNLFTATDVESALVEIENSRRSHEADIAINVKTMGAIGDGLSHPLSSFFSTLSDAQIKYPHATSLADEIDWAAIQGAINYVSSMGGGSVFIPRGQFQNTGLTMKSNVQLVGIGRGSELVNNTESSSIKIGHISEYVFDTKICNIQITGNIANTNAHGIEYFGFNPAYSVVDGVYFKNVGGHGILGGHAGHVNNVEIKGCFIQDCIGDGIHMQYGLGQVNAIWIHHNNIVGCNNGVLFFGSNIIVEHNTIQLNKKYGVSVGDKLLSTNKYCYASSISNNYFELNASSIDSSASVIGIFACYIDGHTNNKIVRSLKIASNFFGESGAKYTSLIYVEDLKDSPISVESCVFQTYNNYSPFLKLVSYNKSTAFSLGCVFDETHFKTMPSSLVSSLPSHVIVRGIADSQYNKLVSVGSTNTVSLTPGNTGSLIYSRTGTGQVWLRGYFTPTAIEDGLVIGTLGSGYYNPNYSFPFLVSANSGGNTVIAGLIITTTGQIKVTAPASTTITNGFAVYINTVFQI